VVVLHQNPESFESYPDGGCGKTKVARAGVTLDDAQHSLVVPAVWGTFPYDPRFAAAGNPVLLMLPPGSRPGA
jgi:hypothetical protein